MKIAFVTACVGPKHIENVRKLFISIRSFYPETDLFVFSDLIFHYGVVVVPVHYVPNPLPALLRYHYMMSIEKSLVHYDHVFWIDADSEIKQRFGPEAFEDVVVVDHPWFDLSSGPFEKNPRSMAYVEKPVDNVRYVQGNFHGGRTMHYLKLCDLLMRNTETDLMARIIPVWYDESHLNWYAQNFPVTQLHPGYAYPFEIVLPYPKIISHHNAHDRVKGFG